VGELFDEPTELVGVCLSTRVREDNLSIWVRKDNTKIGEAARFKIGEKMREILGLDPSIKVQLLRSSFLLLLHCTNYLLSVITCE
jgi:hypothetical protein